MPKSHPPYSPEFRQQIVELVRKGRTPEELARQFEPSAQAIRNWVKQAALDAGERTDAADDGGTRRTASAPPRGPPAPRRTRDPVKSRGLVCTGDQYDPGQGFEFVTAHQAVYPIATMRRVLGVSPSGYYAWRARPLSRRARADVKLSAAIQAIHRESRGTYGVPRIHAELAERGMPVGRKRVARLMRGAGLQGVSRRKAFRTTVRDETARPAPDLIERHFTAAGPDQLWVADITYVPTWAGFLYLAVVVDAWSRRVIGWAKRLPTAHALQASAPHEPRDPLAPDRIPRSASSVMETHLRTELVLAALNMAVAQRRPTAVIHHSDRRCQCTSIAFGQRCAEAGVRPSMGSVGDAYDNALCESFFATLECELLDRHRFRTQVEARLAVFDFIEGWYNPRRRHSALDYRS